MQDEKYKLSQESAEEILQRILDFVEIDINEIEDEKAKSVILKSKSRLIKTIRLGRLQIEDTDGFKLKLNLRSGKSSMDFKIPAATAKRAMGSKAETDFYGRIYAMMGSACGLGEAAIDKLDPVDLSTVEVLGAIFLSV